MNTPEKQCPKCGATVPGEAPQGLCPKCVLAEAATAEGQLPLLETTDIPSLQRVAVAFPQLEVIELIGRGGMGFVFKARQPHLERYVALKLLPDKLARDPNFAERFGREGRVLARLNHPNIVSVFDFGQTGGFYFLMMEYVDGVNLRQAMQAGKFSTTEALTIVPKICEALQFAHEQGVLHRDIKPENILLDAKGRVKIADFGIAKLVGEPKPSVTLTGTGTALGTPHYMAPEQLEKPADVDQRADIYSLGVVFYEMLTGELPIGRFKPPSARTPMDQRIDEIVLRALERERELRQKTATEFKTQVEHVATHPTPPAAAEGAARGPHGTVVIGTPPVVRRTATALVAVGVFNWIGSIIIVALLKFTTIGEKLPLPASMANGFELLPILAFSAIIILGAFKMMRLEMYGLAVTASVLAMITTPGNLAGLPIGIFSLITLCRREVREAFHNRKRAEGFALPPRTREESRYSAKAVWGAALTALAIEIAAMLLRTVLIESVKVVLVGLASALGIVGCILGWVALSDIRAQQGRLRGVPLAVFAAVVGPLLVLVGVTAIPLYFLLSAPRGEGVMPVAGLAVLLVPAGTITFAVWAIYATARWAHGRQSSGRRGILKWVFLTLVLFGIAAIFLNVRGDARRRSITRGFEVGPGLEEAFTMEQSNATSAFLEQAAADTNQWIRFTFTGVDVREEGDKRWLGFGYIEHVHGECQDAFRTDVQVPGFTTTMKATSFLATSKDSPDVLHHRVEFLLPPGLSSAEAQRARDGLAGKIAKSFKVNVGEEIQLFELLMGDVGTMRGWIGVKSKLP